MGIHLMRLTNIGHLPIVQYPIKKVLILKKTIEQKKNKILHDITCYFEIEDKAREGIIKIFKPKF